MADTANRTGILIGACTLAIMLVANVTVVAFRWGSESQQLANIQASQERLEAQQKLQDTKVEQARIDYARILATLQAAGVMPQGDNVNGNTDRRRR